MMQFPTTVRALAIGVVVVASTTACSTKKFVRTQVDAVGQRVDTLSQSIEATQEETRKNGARIVEVDAKTEQAGLWAKNAQSAAETANQAAVAAASKASAIDTASKRLVYEVVISEDQGHFKFGSAELPQEVRTRIDELITQLKADPRGNFVEIEGHTDSLGNKTLNQRLGEERAEAVKMYLYEAHQIPLHKINVISYGEEKPVSPNNTRQGREQNRRVVIRILA